MQNQIEKSIIFCLKFDETPPKEVVFDIELFYYDNLDSKWNN